MPDLEANDLKAALLYASFKLDQLVLVALLFGLMHR
jgi:hypothetical protein